MSTRRSSFPRPGTGRISLAALAVTSAVLAYPWSSARERWVLAVAVAALIVLLGCWRGLFVSTLLRRRTALLFPRRRAARQPRPDVRTTALLRVLSAPADTAALPIGLIVDYLNRYGLRADAVRITSRDAASGRDTWIGLTFSAIDNLAALQARSPRIPLRETAEVAARRLADQLREIGWETCAAGVDGAEGVPELFDAAGRESWHGLADDTGHVAAYQVSVDDDLAETLAGIWAGAAEAGAPETWTAVQISGSHQHPTVAAGCALRTEQPPAGAAPLPGLIPQHGNHRCALQTLHPLATQRLAGHTELAAAVVAGWYWPARSGAAGAPSRARHAAAS